MELSSEMVVTLILLAVISIVLIMSVVHISAKCDEMCKTLNEISRRLSRENISSTSSKSQNERIFKDD